ncbi:MAG: sulfatase-like hydrolase/transferase [Acidimicrobiia bacterium]|nr:sulfatase-like hydrolase/transferase [Acidimicrobiia bacterium]
MERICPATLCGSGPGDGLGALFGDAVGVAGNVADAEGEGSSLVARGTTWDERADDFEEFSASIAPGRDRPVLDYMHSLLPHDPVEYLPNGVKYPAPEHPVGLFLLTWTDEHGAAIGRQRHLLQAQLTDRLLGEALDRLEDAGRFDNTLIVVTADHGVGFTNLEPWRGTSAANYEQIMWTPLLIKEPHQEQGRIDDKNAWSVDVLPTVAEILGVEIPADWEITGHSLIGDGEVRDPSDKVLFTQLGNSLPAAADGLVHVDGVEGFERLLKWSSAPPGDDDLRVWRQGEYGALVGTRPEEHTIGQPAGFDGWLADPDVYDDVDPNHDPPSTSTPRPSGPSRDL